MRRLFRYTAAIVVALIVVSTSALAYSENDAGTGADASNLQTAPTIISSGVTYGGLLHPTDGAHPADADWYGLAGASPSPSCLKITGRGYESVGVTLANGANSLSATLAGWTERTLSLSGSGANSALGLASTDPTRWAGYQFSMRSLSASDLGPADAGTGQDAGSTVATAIAVAPGCFSGSLNPAALDTTDVFTVAGNAGERLAVSLAATSGAPVTLRLIDPNGVPLGTIAPDGLLDVTLPSTGTYSMTASTNGLSLGSIPYIIGTILGPPGCQPAC